MGTVLALGLAAAVYPQLLAIVVVVLTRPDPKPLLWAAYLSAISVSVGAGTAILLVFRGRGEVAGSSAHRLGPAVYLIVGAIAFGVGIFAMTRAGRALIRSDAPVLRWRRRESPSESRSTRLKASAERALRRSSLPVAAAVGAVLGIPGPFDLLAMGHMARGRHDTITLALAILLFNIAKFLLIELPILSYVISPRSTAARVRRFSTWVNVNKVEVVARWSSSPE